ncbi:MAG: cell wall anchor protein [Verrucomicrobiota bacterium]
MNPLPRLRPAALLAGLSLFAHASAAQTTFDWTGSTDSTWGTAANWDPATGAPPGSTATDIARFNDDVANSTVNLDTTATISRLEFASGAGEYNLTGERLVISSSSGPDYIVHNAGNTQTISAELELASSGTFRDINVGAGGTLVIAQRLIFSPTGGQLRFAGGGTLDLADSFSGLNVFTASGSGTTVNLRRISGSSGANRLSATNGATINLYGNHGGDMTLSGANSTISIRYDGVVAGSVGTNSVNVAPTAGNTVTFSADIDGGGTGSFGRQLRLFQAGTVNDATIRFHATSGSVLNVTGTIVDTNAAGAGSKVEITGAGVVRYSGSSANTTVTPILISDGTLELAKDSGVNAIAGGNVTIEENGTLRLAASHQIADATDLVFAGGLFDVGANTETLGALAVGAEGGSIDFGGLAGSITFDSLSSIVGTLTINGWTEAATISFSDGSGWDSETLANVIFTGYGPAVFDALSGELYASAAIPEPASASFIIAIAGIATACSRRRRAAA